MKWNVISGRIWIALATMMVVAALFAYYFFSYIPSRENQLLNKKYRALQRVARNFSEMRQNYESSIELLMRKQQDNTATHDAIDDLLEETNGKQASPDLQTKIKALLDKRRQDFSAELAQFRVEIGPGSTLPTLERRYQESGYLYIKHNLRVKLQNLITNEDIIDNHFDRFLIIRIFNTPESTLSVVAYQGRKFEEANGSESKILLTDITTLFDTAQIFRTIPPHTVKIAGTPFRALSYVMQMAPDEDWILCGLTNERQIQEDVRKIDLIALIVVTLVALFVLLAMPVLKLLIMSGIERLQIINVWFIGFSIVMATALITILLLVSHHYINYREDYEDKLRKLSESVTTGFKNEIAAILEQMQNLEADFANRKDLDTQYEYALSTEPPVLDTSRLRYKYFNELLFMNAKGKVPLSFANHSLPAPVYDPRQPTELPDLSKRKYFSESKEGHLMTLPGLSTPFYVQSIRSWNSGFHEAGVSMQASLNLPTQMHAVNAILERGSIHFDDTARIVIMATATRLRSLMNPLLPPGFQFCVISDDGEVLFHSDIRKNLQENFFEEIDQDYLAKAIVEGRMAKNVEVNYSGVKCLAYIAPLDTRSMFLVTLLDKEYYNTPVVLTVGFVWILTTTMMVILGIQLAVLFCLTYRSSKLRIRRFSLRWISPRSDTKEVSFSDRYARCILAMLIIAIILAAVYFLGFARYLTVAFLTLPVLLLAAHYDALYLSDAENNSARQRNIFVCISLLSILVVTAAALWQLHLGTHAWLILLQLGLLVVVVVNLRTNVFAAIYKWVTRRFSISVLYRCFLCCWLFLVSVLPVFFFYKTAFMHENFLWKKFIQWTAFTQISKRKEVLQKEFADLSFLRTPAGADGGPDRRSYLSKGDYLTRSDQYGMYLSCDKDVLELADAVPLASGKIEELEFELRPPFIGALESSRRVIAPGENVVKWLAHVSHKNLFLVDDKGIVYSSIIPSFALDKGKYALPLLGIFGLFFLCLNVLIGTCVRHIFGWGLLSGNYAERASMLDAKIDESLKNGSHKLFIVGLPYSGKSALLRDLHEAREVKDIFLRTELGTAIDLTGHRTFVIHNFEHALNDQSMNEARLKLFLNLQRKAGVRIVVSSTVEPDSILDILEGKIKLLMEEKKDKESDSDKSELHKDIMTLRNSYRVWRNILSGFEIQYRTLSRSSSDSFLSQELNVGNFLPKLKKYFRDTQDVEEQEEIVLMIEARANAYFQSLWNSFSRKEKHALFDLAKDRFLNLRDASKIRMLINKGIITMEDAPQIVNRSFNNFILSVVKEDEALAMTNELRRKGSWSGIQLILVIALVSVTLFIAVVQQEMLSSVNALVVTISGVVALLVKFSGIFGSTKPKE